MENTILKEALRLRAAGWSVLPMKLKEKKPAYRWKRYQRNPAGESTIRRWFRADGFGLAVIYGEVSGNLASMDFDELEAFHQWEQEHPELAQTLPIVETRRGRHVYFQADADDLRATREALGKNPDGTGAIHLPEGELRAGVGCYSVLPPSIHPSSFKYRWIREPEFPLPVVPTSVFISATCYREDGEAQRGQKTLTGGGCGEGERKSDHSAQIHQAIERTLPSMSGQRHRKLFNLARELKAIPGVSDATYPELKPIVRDWHCRAAPFISTKPFDETWIDFCEGWDKVQFPAGEDPMAEIVNRALKLELPTVAREYDLPQMQALTAICRELQRAAGESAFYLGSRTAGRLLEVTHTHASRYLKCLCRDEVLREVEKGNKATMKASRYRYLHDL